MLLAINVGYCWRKWWMLWFRWWKRWWKGRGKETRGCNYCDRTGGNTGRRHVGTLTRRAPQSRPGFGSEHAILGFYYLSSEKMWHCAKVIQERVLSCCPIQTGWSSAHSSRDSKSWNNKRIPHIPWSACTWPSANWLLNERLPDWPGSTLTTEDLSSKNAFTFVKRMAVATFWWWGYTIILIKDIQNYNLQIVLIDLNVRGARFEPRS